MYAKTLVYMLQSTEYNVGSYLRWWWRTRDFSQVAKRRSLALTRRTRLLLAVLQISILLYILGAIIAGIMGYIGFGIALVVFYPIIWAHLLVVPVWLARIMIVAPLEIKRIKASEKIFAKQAKSSVIVAIVGSYGKTSMKELLAIVLSAHLKVAATPANYNVAISHARFAETLRGDEDVVIVEYGEGAPGDVAKFTETTHPTHAIITGLAPAHLDQYKTVEAAAKDIFSIADTVPHDRVYMNADSSYALQYSPGNLQKYSHKEALGWKITDIKVGVEGISFTMHRGSVAMKLASGLVGRHAVGPLACVAALAFEFGLSVPQIEEVIQRTKPHEHRMQPYRLGGAWIIDDTYNGNIEGIRAGTALLSELPAKRKIYVTPGLVDQGLETETIHRTMGKLIAGAKPDVVVLMCNSVTVHIVQGLTEAGFEGNIRIQDDPLDFYTNLSHFVAAGDVILMQNDWTDNYH